ncbi:flagellar protein FlaG [Planomicrobium sp. MB-3u-38]|uniref:flagellar protein FlaG n=1 Tax=Planomicrobium sp. MB-3u-38 TaxID=2058318 RepID=UPI000C7A6664|nr:flagellar protein FlaG [Planomicrobium sp. MB-3u-38]PKH10367.1 flagellar biosynthesis protein FlaG [Planomicrobium sp. MB-3u-38]
MEVKNSPIMSFPKKIETSTPEIVKAEFKILPEQLNKEKEKEEMTKEMVKNRIDGMNKFVEQTTTAVKFQFHEELNEYYVQVVDSMTDEVLREIPNKKFLDMYASMTELMGLIVDDKF